MRRLDRLFARTAQALDAHDDELCAIIDRIKEGGGDTDQYAAQIRALFSDAGAPDALDVDAALTEADRHGHGDQAQELSGAELLAVQDWSDPRSPYGDHTFDPLDNPDAHDELRDALRQARREHDELQAPEPPPTIALDFDRGLYVVTDARGRELAGFTWETDAKEYAAQECATEPAPGEGGRHDWDCACSPELGPCADHDKEVSDTEPR